MFWYWVVPATCMLCCYELVFTWHWTETSDSRPRWGTVLLNGIRVIVIDLFVTLLHCSISIVAVICYIGLVRDYMRYIRTPVRFHRVPEGNVHWERVSRDVGGVVPRRPTWARYCRIWTVYFPWAWAWLCSVLLREQWNPRYKSHWSDKTYPVLCNVTWLASVLFFNVATAPSGLGPHCRGFTITLRRTILGRTPVGEWSARRRDIYLSTHNTHKRQASMSPEGFNFSKRAAVH